MFFLIKTKQDYFRYICILVFPDLLLKILDIYNLKKYLKITKKLEYIKHLKPLVLFFMITISIRLYDQIDITMLKIMRDNNSVGLYTSASKMTRTLIPIIGSLSTIIRPELIYDIKNNLKSKIFQNIDLFLDFNFFVGFQLIMLLFINSKEIILLFSGEDFIQATLSMKIMLPIVMLLSIGYFMGDILTAKNLEKIPLTYNIISLLLNITLNFLLIPKYGINGASIATLTTEAFNCILKTISVKKLYKDYIFFTDNRKNYIIIGFIITLILYLIKKKIAFISGIFGILLTGTIYITVYFIILLLIKDKITLIYLQKFKDISKYLKKFNIISR